MTFDTTMPSKQVYCNEECRNAARKERYDKMMARLKAEHQTYVSEVLDTLHAANYTCSKCGRKPPQVIPLVVPDGAELKVLCEECIGNGTSPS